jgi:hypothetical protein
MTALVDRVRPPLAPCLARIVREWLPGLSAGDLEMVADATPDQVLQHLNEGPYIQGLHRVQRLQPAPLYVKKTGLVNDDEPCEVADLKPAFSL